MSEELIFKIIEGSLTGEEFAFGEKGLCLIGRSADCALQIPKENDMKISRRHCLLILDPPHVRVRDLGSRNGTTVNGELLDAGAISDDPEKMSPVDRILKDGDVISIGETVMSLAIPSEQPPQVIPASKSTGLSPQAPATKVIQLSKPAAMKTGTLIPKSQPVSAGFFAPPAKNANTTSRTIAMTEAISREELAKKAKDAAAVVPPPQAIGSTKPTAAIPPTQKPGITAAGPLSPPPPAKPKAQVLAGTPVTPPAVTAAGPLAPPPPQKKAPILLGKKKEPATVQAPVEEAPSEPEATEKPRVLKAKIVQPGSTGAQRMPKKLDSHMKTVVMSAVELENMDDLVPAPPEEAPANTKPKKRVTKFKIKGPSA